MTFTDGHDGGGLTDQAAPVHFPAPGAVMPLAVTGGPGQGKSTVLVHLASLGVQTLSADEVVRSAWSDRGVQSRIAERLGLQLPIDKGAVREAVLSDPQARRALNAVLHPETTARIIASGAQAVEVPLLIETCLQGLFRRVWVVVCEKEIQIARLAERLGDRNQAEAFLSTQLAPEVKVVFADAIIRTDIPLNNVQSAVESLARRHGLT